jgi:hypothetical protein
MDDFERGSASASHNQAAIRTLKAVTFRLPCARRERPRRRAAEQRDDRGGELVDRLPIVKRGQSSLSRGCLHQEVDAPIPTAERRLP